MTEIHMEAPHRPNGGGGKGLHWPAREAFDDFARAPTARIPRPGKAPITLATDRVRARPAITPNLALMIGSTAVGLGLLGLAAPRGLGRFLGSKAGKGAFMTLFGLRELVSGYGVLSDPTKPGWLWFRLAGDAFDIVALKALDRPSNPKRGAVRFALGAVLAITALDAITGQRLTGVVRNCVEGERR